MGNRMPYKIPSNMNNADVQKKIDEVRKEFEEKFEKKLKEKEIVYQEEIKKEVSAKDTLKKMLDDIKGKQKESIIDCPTCGVGHVHKLQGVEDGGIGKYKCTGPDCKEEYILVDPASDYMCKTCSMPHKRPKNQDISKKLVCPFCGGKSMTAYDWKAKFDRIKKVV
jgi:DNA-directed RNA polymerase subunit RPC12/RpoP